MTRHLTALLLIALGALATACGPTTYVTAPSGFAQLEDDQLPDGIAQKVISSDGALIVLREREHTPKSDLNFWTDSLQREITAGRGYTLLSAEDVTTSGGLKGKLMHFKGAYRDATWRYSVALFLVDDEIVTVETAIQEKEWPTHEANLQGAIKSLRLR